MKFFLPIFCLLAVCLQAQVATYTPTSTTGVVASNATASVLLRGSGLIPANPGCTGGSWYQSESFTANNSSVTTGFNNGDYWYFTVTPNSGYQLNLTQVSVNDCRRSDAGPTDLTWAYQIGSGSVVYGSGDPNAIGSCSILGNAVTWDFPDFAVASPITFYLIGTGATNVGGTNRIGVLDLDGVVLLPIELMAFDAKLDGNEVLLSFATASERNNDHFVVERSADGKNFAPIGRVRGAGNSLTRQDYTFRDVKPLKGANYYRLQQKDFDGSSSSSPVRLVTVGQSTQFSLAPSPALGTVNLAFETPLADNAVYKVFDLAGRLALEGAFEAESVRQQLEVATLPQGIYRIQILNGQQVMAKSFWKQ